MNRNIKQFNKHLRRILDDLTKKYLGDNDPTSWYSGGCWLLAEALRRVFGGQLWAFTSPQFASKLFGTPAGEALEHVVVRLPRPDADKYVDYFGIQSKTELIDRWQPSTKEWRFRPFKKAEQEALLTGEESSACPIYSDADQPWDAEFLAKQIAARLKL